MLKEKFYRNGYFNDTISSTILFIAAFLFVLYISLASTAFISFTNNLTIPIEIDKIDFDRAFSPDKAIWDSAENIFVIFSFAPITILLIGLISLILTHHHHYKTVGVFLFWTMFHCVMRLSGDFIFGQIYHLWGVNLVTDFMGLTYPSLFLKLFFIALSISATIFLCYLLVPFVRVFFDPFRNQTQEGVRINLFYPSLFGAGVLLLWFIPVFTLKEISVIGFSIIMILFLSNFTIKRYRFVDYGDSYEINDRFNIKLNIIPIIILIIVFASLKVFLTEGVTITSSGFRRDQLDNIFYVFLLIVLIVCVLMFITYIIYTYRKKKMEIKKYMEENEANNIEQAMDTSFLEGTRWSYHANLSNKAQKYNQENPNQQD
ncbi:MAG: hypothetical protein H6Q16_305 [Bacteroidetes bacterium]|nr:hypothetical protein [Bacteroidota bacterium]